MKMAGSEDPNADTTAATPEGVALAGHHRVTRGNFDMGTCLCEVRCIHGHPVRLFNIHRHYFVACDECRRYIHVGTNLMSHWRRENAGVWEENWQSVEEYKQVT